MKLPPFGNAFPPFILFCPFPRKQTREELPAWMPHFDCHFPFFHLHFHSRTNFHSCQRKSQKMASLPKSVTGNIPRMANGQQSVVIPGDQLGPRSASSSPLFPCSSSSMSSSRDSSPAKLLTGDLEPEMLVRLKWPLSGMAARQRRRWRKPRKRPNQSDSELKQHPKVYRKTKQFSSRFH